MPLQSPAYVISASSHSAALFRHAAQTLLAGAGVSEAAGLQVTQNGTPNMSVNVAAGTLWMPGTLGATSGFGNNINAQTAYGLLAGKTAQGMYEAYNDGTVNLPISAADPTNPRIDLVCAAVQDAQYSGSNNQPVLQIISGTAAPSPSPPNAPASAVVLAQVAVGAGVTSIVTANITDKRPILALNGAIVRASGASQYPANPITGDYVDDATLGLLRYNGTAWVAPSTIELGYNESTTNQNISTTAVNTGVIFATVNYTAPATNTKVRIEGMVYITPNASSVSGGAFQSAIFVDGTQVTESTTNIVHSGLSISFSQTHRPACRLLLASGAHTITLRAWRTATGTSGQNDVVNPCSLQVLATP